MLQTSGLRELDSVEKYSKYAVLPQHPWLLNASGKLWNIQLIKEYTACIFPLYIFFPVRGRSNIHNLFQS